MTFNYNPIDLNEVSDVDIVPLDDAGYQSFMASIYDSDDKSDKVYVKWANEYPELAQEYKRLVNEAMEEPEYLANQLDEEIFEGVHDELKEMQIGEYEDDLRYVVRYPDKAERYDLWTYDGNYPDRLVQRCTYGLIDQLRGRQGDDEQRKACLKYAYTMTFETADESPDEYFNLSREEAMLRHLDSRHSQSPEIGRGGREFEAQVRDILSKQYGLELRDPVFRIKMDSGDITYKIMDCHTRIGNTPIVLELFTWRITPEKQDQLKNYLDLYQMATGFEAKGYMVTNKLYAMDEDEQGRIERVEADIGRWGEYSFEAFLDYLESDYGLGTSEKVSLSEYID